MRLKISGLKFRGTAGEDDAPSEVIKDSKLAFFLATASSANFFRAFFRMVGINLACFPLGSWKISLPKTVPSRKRRASATFLFSCAP